MGPTIILDKSIFQRLRADREMVILRKYFLLNVPPVLLDEIRADLGKENVRTTPEAEVQGLAHKLSQFNSAVCLAYGEIMRHALLGADVPMNGTIVLPGVQGLGGDASSYFVASESEMEADYLRWQAKKFNDSEYNAATARRLSLPVDALEKSRNSIKDLRPDLMQYQSVNALAVHVEELLSIPDCQRDLLDFVIQWCKFEKEGVEHIVDRWEKARRPLLKEFTPYAYFCAKALYLHKAGVLRGFFTTKATDLFDLEYVFYLPFCSVFSSSDNCLRKIVPLLIRTDQRFVDGDDLKNDLQKIVECRDGLQGSALDEWLAAHDNCPPLDSQVYEIRKQLGWRMVPNQEKIRKPLTMEELRSDGAVWRKRRVALNGPCICGSPKSFRECCYSRAKRKEGHA